jgi:hypothetical protein
MPEQSLQPFSVPSSFSDLLPNGISVGILIEWIFYIVFAFWAIYTIIAIYHWLKYSHASLIAFPAIALHLFVSFVLVAYALSGIIII